MNRLRAVFLDRDGVINRPIIRDRKPYPPTCLADFDILPGVPEACAVLKRAGFVLVVATNQPDVGRGKLLQSTVEELHTQLLRTLPIDRIEVCYHAGSEYGDACICRKPQPGMLQTAARLMQIDLARSFMVGDRWRDIECGQRAGCRTIFIDWGYRELLKHPPDAVSPDLLAAAKLIVAERS